MNVAANEVHLDDHDEVDLVMDRLKTPRFSLWFLGPPHCGKK